MTDFDKMCVDFLIAVPCKECGDHYLFAPFKKKEDFLRSLEDACTFYNDEKSKNLLKDFPAFAAITSSGADDKNIFCFSVKDGKAKPTKIKWIGESSFHALISEKDFQKNFAAIPFCKDVVLIRNNDMDAFYRKCLEKIENR